MTDQTRWGIPEVHQKNKALKKQGRTANQYKKFIEKEKERDNRGLF